MAASLTYRFFPWVRRGLAGALPPPSGALPARALAKIKIVVTPELAERRDIRLLGPGDIIGIDQRLVVRTEPRPGALDFEPNYMAAVDFDPPELPWLFTPTGPDAKGRVPPWMVLVVLDRERVEPPRPRPNSPLPVVKLPGSLPDTELPDLADSWAWAHVQRVMPPDDPAGEDARELLESPDLNVSRLVAPRRLAPSRRWLACVVPAFDAGVDAGLGRKRRDPEAPLAPAWSSGRSDLELPVYFHWEFDTGLAGDFEFLARRLTPVRASAEDRTEEAERRARAYLGTADGTRATVTAMPADKAESFIRIDAPLEMIDQKPATVAEVPAGFAKAVAKATEPRAGGDLVPPIYGDRHAKLFQVDPAEMTARWLDELNLDPRARVAARQGGDTVRRFQEDLMQAAWTQIGDVLNANALLSRSRFLLVVAQRGLERHAVGLPPARFLALTAPLHTRVRADEVTVRARVARTSLADAAFDGSLRRLTSSVGRLSRATARGVAAGDRPVVRVALARGIAEALQRDETAADPGLRLRDGIDGLALGVRAAEERPDSGPIWAGDPELTTATFSAAALSRRVAETRASLTPRPDLAQTGILTEAHRLAAATVAAAQNTTLDAVLGQVRAAAAASPGAIRFAVRPPAAAGGSFDVVAIERESGGSLVMVESRGRTPLMEVEGISRVGAGALDEIIARTPSAVLDTGAPRVTVRERGDTRDISFALRGGVARRGIEIRGGGARGGEAALPEAAPAAAAETPLFSGVIPAPVRDGAAIQKLSSAFERLAAAQPDEGPTAKFIKAAIGAAAEALPARVRLAIEPATVFRRRALSMVKIPDWLRDPGMDILEPIMRAPVLAAPFAELFGRVAPDRFLPLDLDLPDESITALRTNGRFVAGFLVGANHEMNRELLWRTYPTDGRGTPIRRFWDWFDPARVDIDPIHGWPAAGPLVQRLASGVAQVVLVVRGRLLRRYPNTHVLVWKAERRGKLAEVPTGDAAARLAVLREPVFKQLLPPDTGLVGFDITPEELLGVPEPGWYVVLQEPFTEPRFGLDEEGTPQGRGRSRNDLNWKPTGVAPGGHLPATGGLMAGMTQAAKVAQALLQRPVRVAFHATQVAPAFPGTA